MKKLLILLLSLNTAYAFVDVESYRGKDASSIEAGANHSQNNTQENLDLMGGIILNRVTDKQERLLVTEYVYSKTDSQETKDDFSIHGRLAYEDSNKEDYRSQWEFYSQYENNKFSLITQRSIFGVGKRFSYLGDENKLTLGASAMYEHTNLGEFKRASFYIHKQYKIVSVSAYVQPNLEKLTEDHNTIANLALSVFKTKDAEMQLAYSYKSNNITKEEEKGSVLKFRCNF